MELIQRYELKLNQDNSYTLIVHLQDHLTEFADELGHSPTKRNELQLTIRELMRDRFPHVKISAVKVMAGSFLIVTFYLGGTTSASAQTGTTQTQQAYQYDVHTVQSGDTLYLLAKRFNVSVSSIKEVNALTTDTLMVGQKLKLPFFTYTVSSGDTLSLLAKRYNTTVQDIRSLNQLTGDVIIIGQKIKIPQINELINVVPAPPATENTYTTYTVVSGDTLALIARRFGTTVDAIKSLNTLTTDMIVVGQSLRIPQQKVSEPAPAPEPEFVTYTVVSGDTLALIARRFETTVDAIKSLNNLTTDMIVVGQSLRIPQPTVNEPAPAPEPEFVTYTVVSGDTLFRIAKRFETTVDAIKSLNKLTTDMIVVGQSLRIPTGKAVELDTIAPSAPVLTQRGAVTSSNVTNYLISGTTEGEATVVITVSDGVNRPVTGQITANKNGDYNKALDVSSLNEGKVTITATATDKAGNRSKETKLTVTKDTMTVVPTINHLDMIAGDTAESFEITGTAEPNSTIEVRAMDGVNPAVIMEARANTDGVYRTTINVNTLNDGTVTISASSIDPFGNTSETAETSILKDTFTAIPVLDSSESINSENANSYRLFGTAEPGATIEIRVSDGVHPEVQITTTANEHGEFTETVDFLPLNDGMVAVTARSIDRAGNKSMVYETTLTKDTVIHPPTIESNEPINRKTEANYTVYGHAQPGTTVDITVSDGTNPEVRTTTETRSNGEFVANVDVSSLKDTTVTVRATQTSKAGITSDIQETTVEKDTFVDSPVVVKSGFSYENGKSVYTIIGTAEPYATVTLSIGDPLGTEPTTTAVTADARGFYSITVPVTADFTLTVQQTDRAENVSDPTTIAIHSYTVVAGDTLSAIAKRLNTTVTALRSLNNLTTNTIQVGQTLRLPASASEVLNLGYMYFGNTQQFINTVNQTNRSVNVVSPSYFDVNADGTLKLTHQLDRHFIETMHQQGIRVVPFLSNHWDQEIGRAMLKNKELATQQIADAIERYDLDGVNVDLENITHADRADFTEFVRLLRQKVPATKEVSVAIAANPNGWATGWHGAYDYQNLAKHADYLMIMSYDESYQGGDPGPVASLGWVERSIQYAINQNVPRDKIVIGMAHYGRYWVEGAKSGGFGISNNKVQEMIEKYNGTVVFDERSQSPKATITIRTGDPKTFVGSAALSPGTYTIWFENEKSMRQKLALVGKYNIRGVGNWSLGQENVEVWNSFSASLPTTVPVTSAPNTKPVTQTYSTYTVVAGDSLWVIANRFNTSITAIKDANNLASDTLYVGQTLKIPQKEDAAVETVTEAETTTYTVAAGDTLWLIASHFNTTVSAIKEANHLTTDTIYVGQRLKIPS